MKIAIYTDINTLTLDSAFTEDIKAVLQALYNLFTTEMGERRGKPLLGLMVNSQLFGLFDDDIAFQIKTDLVKSVRDQEPRVNPIFAQSTVTADAENKKYNFRLIFTVIGLTDRSFEYVGAIFK